MDIDHNADMKVVDVDDYTESENVLKEPRDNDSTSPNPKSYSNTNPKTLDNHPEIHPTDITLIVWLTSNWPRIVRCQTVIVWYAIITVGLILLWTIPIILYGLIPYHVHYHGNDITELS
eukprot:PhF_6_TR30216/c0_g1_i1/m.44403